MVTCVQQYSVLGGGGGGGSQQYTKEHNPSQLWDSDNLDVTCMLCCTEDSRSSACCSRLQGVTCSSEACSRQCLPCSLALWPLSHYDTSIPRMDQDQRRAHPAYQSGAHLSSYMPEHVGLHLWRSKCLPRAVKRLPYRVCGSLKSVPLVM